MKRIDLFLSMHGMNGVKEHIWNLIENMDMLQLIHYQKHYLINRL